MSLLLFRCVCSAPAWRLERRDVPNQIGFHLLGLNVTYTTLHHIPTQLPHPSLTAPDSPQPELPLLLAAPPARPAQPRLGSREHYPTDPTTTLICSLLTVD